MKPEFESATVSRDDEPSDTRKISVVNGYIVYTRAKRSLSLNSDDVECKRFREEAPVKLENNGARSCTGRDGECDNELKNEPQEVSTVRTFKRFTRSAMKASVESESGEMTGTELEQGASVASGGTETNGAIAAPRNKFELKMSKKIVVNRKPMTVKELFDTGLLDGVPVVYMGGIKKVRLMCSA